MTSRTARAAQKKNISQKTKEDEEEEEEEEEVEEGQEEEGKVVGAREREMWSVVKFSYSTCREPGSVPSIC